MLQPVNLNEAMPWSLPRLGSFVETLKHEGMAFWHSKSNFHLREALVLGLWQLCPFNIILPDIIH